MRMGKGKVETAKVLMLKAPESKQQWSQDWICMRL